MCGGAGVSPAFFYWLEIGKIAGGTPAPEKTALMPDLAPGVSPTRIEVRKKHSSGNFKERK
jgi:hypothetical protein